MTWRLLVLVGSVADAPAGPPECAVGRRRAAIRGVGDHAAHLLGRPAGGDVLEAAPGVLSGRDRDVAAEKDRRHQSLSQRRVCVELIAQHHHQHPRALRMPDEDDRPAVVLVREVVVPGVEEALVGDGVRLGVPTLSRLQRGQRSLAVDRCPHAAHLREARRLGDSRTDFGQVHPQVGVGRLLLADGRVRVEAVELRVGRGSDLPDRRRPARRHRCRVEARCTGIGRLPWTAQPDGGGGIGLAACRCREGGSSESTDPYDQRDHEARTAHRSRVATAFAPKVNEASRPGVVPPRPVCHPGRGRVPGPDDERSKS